jgi:adenylate cyclase
MGEPATESARKLTRDRLARESGATTDYVGRLLAAGAIHADESGMFDPEDIPRVQLAQALSDGGVALDDLMSVIQSGELQLDWVARLWKQEDVTDRTFGEFAGAIGERASRLPAIYAAFGLAVPPPESLIPEDEEQAVVDFLDLWTMLDDRVEVDLRAAHIVGDGVRRMQGATQDLFDELGGPPRSRLRRGLSPADAVRPAMRLSPVVAQLLVWLQRRHQEHEVFARIVTYVEDTLAAAGRREHADESPAIAFADLTGYTHITAEGGDEQAARFAATLQGLADTAAGAYRGRVVKLLGDGVMLRFSSSVDAVESVRSLMTAATEAGLPSIHAGIAAGPLVVRDGDVYGHVVNLAARIAAFAPSGELLVTEDVSERLGRVGIPTDSAGLADLKGLAGPVALARVLLHD